ncbi:MAG TPA: SDR family oxidoreductase [Bacteroidales bacterium]|nr:SDR family oxidoreductase [Bacteroidales bacterium]
MNIVVNGGTRGIGREVVIELSHDSANNIIVTGRNEKSLELLSSNAGNIHAVKLDLTSSDKSFKSLIDIVNQHFNSVDILINNAGLLISKRFIETNEDEARLIMETNFFGPALLIRKLKPVMAEGSHILNISSMGGFQGSAKFDGLAYYSAAKAAISCLSECLAVEFADSKISVNCLALGAVQTEMLEEAFPGYKAPVTAKEMAEFISYFAKTGHKFFNGKILPVAVSTP